MNIQKRACAIVAIVVQVACALCLLAAPLAFPGQRVFAQTLELPPPEEVSEQAPPTQEKSESAKSSAAKAKAKASKGAVDKEKALEQQGEEEAQASEPSDAKAAPSDHKSNHAEESSDHAEKSSDHAEESSEHAVKGSPAHAHAETQGEHDKAAESAQAGHANPERSAAKGAGLIWFAAAFVVLVVAVFVLT